MKKEIALLAAIIVLGSIWISHLNAQIDYADTECPVCGSCEVLDFGESEHGERCYCYDCETEFYITPITDYEQEQY